LTQTIVKTLVVEESQG